jgi:hypothetical protein
MKLFPQLGATLVAAIALLCLGASPAAAQIAFTPGSGGTMGSVTCGSDKCPKHTLVDSGAGDMTDATLHALQVKQLNNVSYTGTTTALAANATYTGAARDSGMTAGAQGAYAYYNAFFLADQVGTASVECSNDSATWFICASSPVVAATPMILSVPVMFRYQRSKLVNGATAQTSFVSNSSYTGG